MKAIKLTPKERELFESLKSIENGKLRQHVKPSNLVCFRLLDSDFNPLKNYRYGLVHQLIDKGILQVDGQDYILRATSDTKA